MAMWMRISKVAKFRGGVEVSGRCGPAHEARMGGRRVWGRRGRPHSNVGGLALPMWMCDNRVLHSRFMFAKLMVALDSEMGHAGAMASLLRSDMKATSRMV